MAYRTTNRFVNKVGLHHFAHLRALAEGIDAQKSAERYLGTEHGHQARAASLQTIDAVRTMARRRGDHGWRLIGMTIQLKQGKLQPTFDDFIAERDMEDWSEEEIAIKFAEVYPVDPKAAHRAALREKIIKLLRDIEDAVAETPKPTDMVSGWYDERTAKKLISAGIVTLGDLQTKIAIGGRWHSAMPAIGKGKALRIAKHLELLLTPSPTASAFTFTLGDMDETLIKFTKSLLPKGKNAEAVTASESKPNHISQSSDSTLAVRDETMNELIIQDRENNALLIRSMLSATNDVQASITWVKARAGSTLTAINYIREAIRLLLWLKYECNEKRLIDFKAEDCFSYMAFLQNIPTRWMSRKHVSHFKPGWAPFRGQLNQDSFKQTVIIVSALFTFLAAAEHIHKNPWVLVNKKIIKKDTRNVLDTKALSSNAVLSIIEFLKSLPPSPALARFMFIFIFTMNVGLRSAELLKVQLCDFLLEKEGWMLRVVGKGNKRRTVAIPDVAFNALEIYLTVRGCTGIEYATSDLPLISHLYSNEKLSYQALYKSMKSWFSRTVKGSKMDDREKKKLVGATTHWLRHTFGTEAVERGVPEDVIKDQMGLASIDTVHNIYGRAPIKRINTEIAKAFD